VIMIEGNTWLIRQPIFRRNRHDPDGGGHLLG
jgi:hypothetical protein